MSPYSGHRQVYSRSCQIYTVAMVSIKHIKFVGTLEVLLHMFWFSEFSRNAAKCIPNYEMTTFFVMRDVCLLKCSLLKCFCLILCSGSGLGLAKRRKRDFSPLPWTEFFDRFQDVVTTPGNISFCNFIQVLMFDGSIWMA